MCKPFLILLVIHFFASHVVSQSGYPASSEISIVVETNNVSGGGFQSDVSVTNDGMTVYSSADVSGIFKSTDGGLTYKNVNEGLKSPKVASLAITPDNEDILYAGTGDKGGSGGLFRSIDGGEFWLLTGDGNNAQFSGNHAATSDPVPNGHPRSNGDLIVVKTGSNALTYTDDIVIAGTYKNGVKLFTQGGEHEASSLNANGFVRSIAYNPDVPNTAYAAIQFSDSSLNGIYEIDISDPNNASSILVYQTALPEGLTVLSNGNVYAAIGKDGIVKFNGTSWFLRNTGLSINNANRQWTAVTGYNLGSNDVVYIGTTNLGGNENGADYSNIWRSGNGGNSWTALVDNNVSDKILGKTYDWWFRTNAFQEAGLGRKNSVVSSIDISLGPNPVSTSDDIIYVSGRGGIWKSGNGGDTWNPAVYNMQATANSDVTVNPNDASQVVIANTDYVLLETGNIFENNDISKDKPSGAESRCYDVIVDEISDEIILGVGDRGTNNPGGGEVYIKAASAIGNPSNSGWFNTNLRNATGSNNGRVRAVTYGYHNGGSQTSQTILAAVEGEGVYRYKNGSWAASTGVSIGATKRCNFVWPENENKGTVYLLDISSGLYRSYNGGQSWTNIWPSMNFNNNDFFNTGYLTADKMDNSILYISIQGGDGSPIDKSFKVYRMKGANGGIFQEPSLDSDILDITQHSGSIDIKRPGPLVFGGDGKLWLTQQQNSANGISSGLYVMDGPVNDLSFKNVTTNEYRNIATKPSGIDVSNEGHVYISQNGTGLVKIKYTETYDIGLSDSCIEVYAESNSNIYTVSGDLSTYDINIIYPNGAIYENLNSDINDNGTAVSFDKSSLPAGIFLIRVLNQNNDQLLLEQIVKK